MVTANSVLDRLKQGNERFVKEEAQLLGRMSHSRRMEVVAGQQPCAAILGCADSRVPVEELFDQGIGDLFVVRVAGNFAGNTQIGSLEYAAQVLEVPLIVVLGHSHCGAIGATIEALKSGEDPHSCGLQEIVGQLRPAVEAVLDFSISDHGDAGEAATDAHVRATVDRLCGDSELLAGRIDKEQLKVVGAKYDLASGKVEWFE